MQLKHASTAVSASFDDPNLVSAAGLVPIMALAERAGLRALAQKWLSVPTDKGANAGLKVASLVGGMVAGADSIDDMAILRHGGMAKLFAACYAPSTLGSFLRKFTFGHVRQLDAVASRFLTGLAGLTGLFITTDTSDAAAAPASLGTALPGYAFLDVDDTIIEVHGHQKQGAGYGYSGVRGINALLAIVSTTTCAPVIVTQRLRRGACGSPRGAKRLIADALAGLKRLPGLHEARVLFRADSAYYGHAGIQAAITAGAHVSVTVRMNPQIRKAITSIPENAWTPIQYTNAIKDEETGTWVSTAEVAEIDFTAFTSRKKTEQITGRLVVRRIPELNRKADTGQPTLFDIYRFHGFFTTSDLDTVTADKTHRAHAIIEAVNADLKNSALAHMPSGVFCANAAWLVLACIAFNLTRAAAAAGSDLAKATTGTIRRTLVNLPARIATSARKVRLHLPQDWPWESAWTALFSHACSPPGAVTI